eukprot:scaffold3206_cov72-Phaeocystis_antarctica.AAC.2
MKHPLSSERRWRCRTPARCVAGQSPPAPHPRASTRRRSAAPPHGRRCTTGTAAGAGGVEPPLPRSRSALGCS